MPRMDNHKDCHYCGLQRAQTLTLTWDATTSSTLCTLIKDTFMLRTWYSKLTNSMFSFFLGEKTQILRNSPDPASPISLISFPLHHLFAQNRFVSAGRLENQSYFSLTGSKNVILDWVKKAEDSSAVIVRLFEAYGGRSSVTLHTGLPVKKVQHSNFLEDDTQEYLSIVKGGIDLTLDAFEVVTLKLEL